MCTLQALTLAKGLRANLDNVYGFSKEIPIEFIPAVDRFLTVNANLTISRRFKPSFFSAHLSDGLRWGSTNDFIYEEKLDGCFAELIVGDSILVGEKIGKRFVAFDVPIFCNADIRHLPLTARLDCLSCFEVERPETSSNGGELLQRVITRGGEGIVRKRIDAAFGVNWTKCKRVETFDVLIAEKHSTKLSVRMADESGNDYGWLTMLADFNRVRVGDYIEVAAFGRHSSGKLREARFIRKRYDLPPAGEVCSASKAVAGSPLKAGGTVPQSSLTRRA